ncbi:MAG TPA: glycosyltransferase family 39 protein [Thermomicrobiales bacterium]|nr:glycosyltransferase family 39 protein [Thermomicrobiales bacterium]
MTATKRRPGATPPGSARARWMVSGAALPRGAIHDVLALLLLGVALTALLAYAAALPPTRLAFAIDQPPAGAVLQNFYGVEHNGTGAFRWSKPQASLIVPVNRPGPYRVTLTMQDSPSAPPRRVTLSGPGTTAQTEPLETSLRGYTVVQDVRASDQPGGRTAAIVELATAPFVPAGDQRALGVILARVTIEPARAPDPWQPALLLPDLLLFLGAYGATRALGARPARAALLMLGLAAVFALLAVVARPAALALAMQPGAQPLWFAGLLLFLSPLPLVRRAWPAAATSAGPGAGAARVEASPVGGSWGDRARRLARPALLLPTLVALALGLRLYHFNHLSLWLDEGFTVLFARQPWPVVLGLRGLYDVHPPLYYVLTKLMALAVPEVDAGRLVSVLAGTLTVPVLYALGTRLAGRRVGLGAGLVLALSPLHVWYSQEARMYALLALLVAVSYLALVAYYQRAAWHWLVLYGCGVLAALYTDFTAVYALAPQIFVLALVARRHGRLALAPCGVAGLAGLGFLPWLAQAADTVGARASSQAWFLAATPSSIADSLLAIAGISGASSYYWGAARTPAVAWPHLRGLFLGVALLVVVAGAVALWRRRRLAPLVVMALGVSTIGTATLVSLGRPGYADRTILCATLGWALCAGAVALPSGATWLRRAGFIGLAGLLALVSLSDAALYRGATKQEYRTFAAATARAAQLGLPVLTFDRVSETLITAYQPQVLQARYLRAEDRDWDEALAGAEAVWFAHPDYSWERAELAPIEDKLAALGYRRVAHRSMPDPLFLEGSLFLDLYARPDAQLGAVVSLDGAADAWAIVPAAAGGATAGAGAPTLTLAAPGAAGRDVPAVPGALYLLRVTAQAVPGAGQATATLACLDGHGTPRYRPEDDLVPALADDGDWHDLAAAVLCPPGTAAVRITLANHTGGVVRYRDLRLRELTPRRR